MRQLRIIVLGCWALACAACGCGDADLSRSLSSLEIANCSYGYLVQGAEGDFYRIDIATGDATPMTDDLDSQINAIGYNPLDHKIYGLARTIDSQDPATLSMVVGTIVGDHVDIEIVEVPVPVNVQPSVPRQMYVGDITVDGRMIMSEGRANGFITIDVNPDSATYMNSVTWTPYSGDGRPGFAGDWCYSLLDGYLYTIDRERNQPARNLWRVDPNTGQTTNLGDSGIPAEHRALGACYMTAEGISYWGDNSSGTIYRLDLRGVTDTAPTATVQSVGPGNVAWNDGARCYLIH